ncbi:choice-of-anchor L domain-containing protein [Flavobacterium hauense]
MKKISLIFFLTLLSWCGYGQLALEGFEGTWSPAAGGTSTTGWFQFQNSVGPQFKWTQSLLNVSTQPPYEGSHAAYLQRENVAPGLWPEDYLVTPQFTMPENPELRFFSRLTLTLDQGSIYKVFILDVTANPTADLNSPASYVQLQSWTELEINPEQQTYNEIIKDLPAAYIGKQVRIAFMMTGDEMDRWLIDNVKVVKKCEAPLNIVMANSTLNSADLSWDNPSGSVKWDVEIVQDGMAPLGTGVEYAGTLPYHATALTAGGAFTEDTCYKFYVRSKCDGGGVSPWAGPFYFCTKKTGNSCSFPIEVSTLPYSDQDDTAEFGDEYNGVPGTGCGSEDWQNYLSGNDVVYRYTANFTGAVDINLSENGVTSGIFIYNECQDIGVACLAGGVAGFEGNPVALENFPVVSGEDYYIVISSYEIPTTPYQLIIQAVACDKPTNLSVGSTGLTSAVLSWDNPTGATSWEVAVQTLGSSIPSGSGTTVTDNSDYLWTDGLVAATAYQYWVRADCGTGTFSTWAGPFRFNTQICDPIFQCDLTFIMSDEWDSWNGYTMSVKQNGLTLATLTGPGDDGETVEQNVSVCHNVPVQLYWHSGGSSWQASEIGVSIKNSFGQTIYVKNPGMGVPNSQLYNANVDCEKPLCLPPEDLTATNIDLTTVDLGWNGAATGNWDYYIVPAGSPAPTAATPGMPTTTNPAVGVGSLVPGTNYEYYVRVHCEDASTPVSDWGGPFAFTSSVCPLADKCFYDFVLKASWNGWEDVVLTVTQNGANVAILGPQFTSGTSITVPVGLCTNVPFEVTWTGGTGWPGQAGLEIINNFDQTIFNRELGSDIGGIGVVLFADAVDCLHPKCMAPTDLTSANGTMTSVDLGWNGLPTGNWEYIVLPAGSPAPTETTVGIATTANPTIAAPLDAPATNYDFYVRAICEDSSTPKSAWGGPLAIHSEACDPADKCIFHFELLSENGSGFDGNTMTVYQSGVPAVVLGPGFDWMSPDPKSFMVDVALCPDLPIEIVWNNGGWSEDDKGLHVYSPYMEDVFIKDFGVGAQGETIFQGIVSCSPPPCPKPINLSVSNVALNSVTLEWHENGTATSWEVWVLPYGSPVPTEPGTPVTDNPLNWPGLESGTPYVFYVRANCETDGLSTITGPFAFATLIENDDCGDAINVPVNTGAACVNFVPGTLTGATSSGVASSCEWDQAPEYDVWYSFTATGPGHAIAIKDAVNVQINYTVYEGDGCGNLTEIACARPAGNDAGAQGVVTGLVAGTTYYVQVSAGYFPNPSVITSFKVCISSPASIIVDAEMSVHDIVFNALVVETCANIENITSSTGTDFDEFNSNGIAYFEKGDSNFGIEKGVVLMSGDARKAAGPNIGNKLSDGYWPGDEQLFDYIDGLGIDGDLYQYNDATILEFDFTPLANKLRFPFIFASEEYGEYQCTFSDAFAFFLTEVDDDGNPIGPTTNLAVVPNTNSPVSVVTIRDGKFSPDGLCESVNEAYFADYYGTDAGIDLTNAIDGMFAPINFQGFTVKMFAESDVIANHKYHIKLVVADRNDNSLDSAVFIGAFDIGKPDLGENLTIADGNGVCDGDSYTLVSDLDPLEYVFTWYKKEIGAADTSYTVIAGETTNQLVVTTSGEYKVNASFGGLCNADDTVIVEFYDDVEITTGSPVQLVVCDADGFATFNLSDNTANVLSGVANSAAYVVSYHLTEDDAKGDLNPLPLTDYENVTQGLQEIYVRIVDANGCVGVKSFSLLVQDLTPQFTINENFSICQGSTGVISVTPVAPANYDPATVTYTWTYEGNALPDTTASIVVLDTAPGLYSVTVNNQGCPASDSVNVAVLPSPVADNPDDVVECTSYFLPELSVDNRYYTQAGGAGVELSAGEEIKSTQVIYVRAFNQATPDCAAENDFKVTIIPTAFVSIDENCIGQDYVLKVNFEEDEVYTVDNATFEWKNSTGVVVGSEPALTVVTPGSYFLTVTPSGQSKNCPVTIEAQIDDTTCLIPRGISPNSDGFNDSFDLTTLDVTELKIFNRYGQEVYSKRDYTKEWVGQNKNGDELPSGTYFYMIERANGESKTGWVYINRQD